MSTTEADSTTARPRTSQRVLDLRDEVVGTRLAAEEVPDLADVIVQGRQRGWLSGLWILALLGDVAVLLGCLVLAPRVGAVEAMGLVVLWVLFAAVQGTYDNSRLSVDALLAGRLVQAAALTVLAADLVVELSGAPVAARPPAVLVVAGTSLVLLFRLGLRMTIRLARRRGAAALRLIAVGPADTVTRLLDRPPYGWTIVAACVPENRGGLKSKHEGRSVAVVGRPQRAAEVARQLRADAVWVASGTLTRDELRRLGWQLGRDVRLLVSPGFDDVHSHRLDMHLLDDTPVLELRQPRFTGGQLLVKNLIDRTGSLLGLVVLAPLLALLVVLIRRDSPGPAVFRQQRVGLNGRPFTCYKLRSMHVDAEARLAELTAANVHARDGVLFKLKDDPRVTRIGRTLRRLSLDELPQLLNVLKGDMSLVGPRPPLPKEVDQYELDVRRRLLVKPGITGLWQVSGRSDLTWEESVRLDLSYVDNWSPRLDTVIVLRTVWAVLASRGAY